MRLSLGGVFLGRSGYVAHGHLLVPYIALYVPPEGVVN